ncbi:MULTISPECIES: MarR family winged helix-turn-helix transcriptional regulator [Methylobacteriaceae]|uniref:MarR family winged helix-turn-helix transcriptional regulator n=1 Tax=Methylobacteriaceae TaxID=119045 RepID=UPI00074FAAD7|nr:MULTISPECIES: MarR family transcriptional regulator [Methylobacteriaceae]MCJ2032119.1 MarR family transcriptional regulator [Methylobacterium sp. J-043]MCP1551573.1 DNA-binding MarR family transcriptional regulator [Methylorubrum zatmanii]MDF9861064.1 DNA-binding MarR family transcriptional regulator [Methylorubrum pseudosasae]MDH6640103.1 DNA-binding MarR family transcriptional regulator [Methylobacterium sp. SuP10 SLI 274]AMB47068.1 MarR family transcriptional regulator [Methylobacterium 
MAKATELVIAPADLQPRLGAIEDLVGYHLRRASTAVRNDFARVIEGSGMRQVLFGILSVVEANPGINQGAIGRVLGIHRANMVVLVNELIEKGWISRRADEADRRAFVLDLTPEGQAVFAEVRRQLHAHEATLLAELDAAECAQLIALLRRIGSKDA